MQSVWVKKGTMQWWRDWKPHKWIDVHFALEQFSGSEGNKDGILFIYYNFYEEKKVCSSGNGMTRSDESVLFLLIAPLPSSSIYFFFLISTYCFLSFPLCCHSLQYLHAFVNEVTILVPVLSDSKHTFAIYTPERTKQRWPIRLAAATELEMHDWVRMDTT